MTVDLSRRALPLALLALVLPVFAIASNKGVAPLVGLCAVAVLVLRRGFPRPDLRRLALPALFLAWSALSLFWTIDPGASAAVFRLVLIAAAGWVLFEDMAALSDGERAAVLRMAALGTGAAALLLVICWLDRGRVLGALTGRLDWENKLKPAATILAILMWPAAIHVWRHQCRSMALIFLLGVTPPLFLIDAKAGRLGMIAAAMVFMAALAHRRVTAWALGAMVAATIVLAPLVALQPARHPDIVQGMSSTARHRFLIWDFVAERIGEHPFLGWGFNTSRVMPGGHREIPGMGEVLPLHPHNAALQIWLELGLPAALLAAAGAAALAVAAGRWGREAAAGALAAYAATVVIALLSYGIWQDWWLLSLVFALVLCRALPQGQGAMRP